MILERFRPYLAPDEGADALDGAGDDAVSTAGVEDVTTTTTEDAGLRLRDLVKELGHEYGEDFDDEKIARDLATRAKQAQELEQRVRLADEHNRLLQHHLSQFQQRPQQAPAQTEQQKRELAGLLSLWNKVPEYSEDWLSEQFVGYDENGNLVAKPGADPSLPQKIKAHQKWQRQALETMLHNPLEFVPQAFFSSPYFGKFVQDIEQRMEQRFHALHRQQEVTELFRSNAGWMVSRDAQGNPSLTEEGAMIARTMQQLEEANDGRNYLYRHLPPAELFRHAKLLAEDQLGRKIGVKPDGKKPEPETREGKKLAALRDRSRLPDTRAAGKPTETTPRKRTTRLSLEGAMLDAARDQGVVQAVSSD